MSTVWCSASSEGRSRLGSRWCASCTAEGAAGGYVVTSGTFTKDARQFAAGRNVELIDGQALDGL